MVRVNDVDGHIEYVNWLRMNHSLPSPNSMWESFQPPLYYAISAVFGNMAYAMTGMSAAVTWTLQFIGLLFSIATLGVGAWIAALLFPWKERRREHLLLVALFATFPTLVMIASKINNDVSAHFFGILAIALLIRFWQTSSSFHWYALTASIILGSLSKLNIIFLLPIALITLVIMPHIPVRRRLVLGALMTLLTLVGTEWFYAATYLFGGNQFPIVNGPWLQDSLRVNTGVSSFLGFHPLRFLRIPYLDPFGDDSGRQFFWEYFLKSAVFGEYSFGPALMTFCRILLGVFLAVVGTSVIAAVHSLLIPPRRSVLVPLGISTLILLAAHIAFRIKSPFSCSQDFRYSLPLIVPLIVFPVALIPSIRSRRGQWLLTGFLGIFVVLSAAFFFLIIVVRPL
jgi:hypothetical protein